MNNAGASSQDVNTAAKGASAKTAAKANEPSGPRSMRSRRTPNWARSHASDDGYSRYPCGNHLTNEKFILKMYCLALLIIYYIFYLYLY